jgi:hypothetical protein
MINLKMSKNTELLSGFLTCMIKLTDKLHATNNKLVDHSLQIVDLSGKLENLDFQQTGNINPEQLSSLMDCSSFEVMPNKEKIVSGTIDDVTGLMYNNDVLPCTVHKMSIESFQTPENCDVVVDWGDGQTSSIKKHEYISYANNSYELSHDYLNSMSSTSKTQRFIIKIYGKNYWLFRHNSNPNNNLISKIFDSNLSLASHIANIESTCYGAMRLLKVHFHEYYRILNLNNCFYECKNLVSATGFGLILNNENVSTGGLFEKCFSLNNTDFRFPSTVSEIGSTFANCRNLSADINSLLPEYGFERKTITIGPVFSNCKSIYGLNFDKKLWNDSSINWIIKPTGSLIKMYPFTDSKVKNIVPMSWGGTASDNLIVDTSLSSKLNDINSYIFEISGSLNNIILSGVGGRCECGDVERFVDPSELEIRLDELEIKDIDVNDKELIDLVNNLNNDLHNIISGSNISLRDELAIIHAKINKLSGLIDDQVICGGVVDPNIERFIDESELSTHLSYFDSKFIDEDEMDQRLNNLDLSDINIGDGSLLDNINKLKNDIK